MLIHSGNHIGDSWYYTENDLIHCFYLTCPDTVERHTAWDIGHATSPDLVNWKIHDLVLKIGEPGTYDGRCPATGSILRFQDRYWMAYTGNWGGPEPTVALAVSDDLYHWDKCAWNPVTRIDPQYYEPMGVGPAQFPHWRDPFLFEYEGAVYHYVCARRNIGADRTRGTLGLAKTHDMRHWEVLPPPEVDPVCGQLEVPQVYYWGERYYLVFSANAGWFSDAVYARYPRERFRDAGYSMVGPTPFGPFSMHGTGQILPSEDTPQPYAVQLVFWKGKPYLLGTVWNDEQDFICDPIPVQFTETGVMK
jgi:beta-fructofuranosidase